MRVGLAILNRNEAAAVPAIVPEIPRESVELCFAVDGGSTDGSREMLIAAGIEVLPEASAGRGEAFRLAFARARGEVDALVFFSADGNENPKDIAAFRQHFESGADVVIASRMMAGAFNEEDEHWYRPRKWGNLAFSRAAHALHGRGQPFITDSINGFRGFTLAAWERLAVDGNGYTVEFQSSIRAYRAGMRVVEFPTHEGQRIGGQTGAFAGPIVRAFTRLLVRELGR